MPTKLPEYKGYTVDYRLREFRKIVPMKRKFDDLCKCQHNSIEYISFDSDKGDKLLCEMIKKNLVPEVILSTIF